MIAISAYWVPHLILNVSSSKQSLVADAIIVLISGMGKQRHSEVN